MAPSEHGPGAKSRLQAVSFDVAEVEPVAAFWAELLHRDAVAESGAVLVPGDDTQVGLRFVTAEPDRTTRPRLHLHLTSSSSEDQQRSVGTVLRLGGRHLDIGQKPEEGHIVLADPAGNALCVIEPGNAYLAGTGYFGEVTGDGSRALGLFWSAALGWPLVWEEGEQTAIQSPLGGTKIAWDPSEDVDATRAISKNGQRFDLVSPDVADEVNRLVSLGATVLTDRPERVELTDPDGYAFSLRAG